MSYIVHIIGGDEVDKGLLIATLNSIDATAEARPVSLGYDQSALGLHAAYEAARRGHTVQPGPVSKRAHFCLAFPGASDASLETFGRGYIETRHIYRPGLLGVQRKPDYPEEPCSFCGLPEGRNGQHDWHHPWQARGGAST